MAGSARQTSPAADWFFERQAFTFAVKIT